MGIGSRQQGVPSGNIRVLHAPGVGEFDIDRFKPELFCIEAKPRYRKKIIEHLEAHGYARLERYAEHDPMNYYFAPRPSLAER